MPAKDTKTLRLASAPWHKAAETMQTLFRSKRIGDPMTDSGWQMLTSTEGWQDSFKNELFKNIPGLKANEEHFLAVESMIDNTLREVANPFSPYASAREGLDAMAPNANYNQFARLNPFTILGYIARCKVIDMFHTVNSDKPTITYEYNYEYILKGDDPTTYQVPQSIRDGSLMGILDLPRAVPHVSGDAPWIHAAFTNAGTTGANALAALIPADQDGVANSDPWIAIGSSGNILEEAGFPAFNHSLERNISIATIRWMAPVTGVSGGVAQYLSAYLDRDFASGDTSQRIFKESFKTSFVDTGAANAVVPVTLTLLGVVNLDTGDYSMAQAGTTPYITHFQFLAHVTNLANEMGTVRGGAKKFIETFDVNNKITGTVPISQLMADDFNLAGEGVTYTAYMVDKMTEAYAGFRDLEMERELDRSYMKPKESFRLFAKLGGYDGPIPAGAPSTFQNNPIPFIYTARGAGGGDVFQWARDGLRDMIRHVLVEGDVRTQFESSIPRSWQMYGAEKDIQRIPDITYTNYAGEGDDGSAAGNYRYGFAVDTAAGFSDNFGRRVKVIGSKDSRRWGKPIVCQLKSTTLEQPTTVYFPYSFRVFSGISPEYGKLPALCIFQRDYIGTLTKAQVRFTIDGNDVNAYARISQFSAGGGPALFNTQPTDANGVAVTVH